MSGIRAYNSISGVFENVKTSNIALLDISPYANDHRFNVVAFQTVADDIATANINRTSGITGGTDASINSAFRVANSVHNSDAYDATTNPYGGGAGYNGKPYEWGISVLLNNGRNYLSGGYRGQNGAGLFAGYRKKADAGGTWGINVLAIDFPGLSDPTELLVSGEFDIHGDGTDANHVRVGVSSNIKSTGTTDLNPSGYGEGSWAFFAGCDGSVTTGAWFSKWQKGYYARGPMDVAIDVSDTSNATATTPYATLVGLRLYQDQLISLKKDDSKNLRYSSSKSAFCYQAGGVDLFSIDNSGNFGFGAPAFVTAIAGFTWGRISNTTNGGALQVDDGTVFGTFRGGSGAVYLQTDSNHDLIFLRNGTLAMRAYSDRVEIGLPVRLTNTVNVVSPTTPNRTVTMVINGTTYYLAAKTTND
jgi:hypothetical protein